jgi:hypothetical protein
MIQRPLTLLVLDDNLAVCRLGPKTGVPTWASAGQFCSITRTADELSVVCPQSAVPEGVQCEGGWLCFRVAGAMDFCLVGVLASLVVPLAEAGVSVFAISTFDTDYLLVKEADFEKAKAVLRQAGHIIDGKAVG